MYGVAAGERKLNRLFRLCVQTIYILPRPYFWFTVNLRYASRTHGTRIRIEFFFRRRRVPFYLPPTGFWSSPRVNPTLNRPYCLRYILSLVTIVLTYHSRRRRRDLPESASSKSRRYYTGRRKDLFLFTVVYELAKRSNCQSDLLVSRQSCSPGPLVSAAGGVIHASPPSVAFVFPVRLRRVSLLS